jgi:hypothetical protein
LIEWPGAAVANRNLNADELKRANELLKDIRGQLTNLAVGDPLLLFAYPVITLEPIVSPSI